jgi:hypothetical protein
MEVSDLLSRDITPEDYELLLRLDATVAKPVVSKESIEGLPPVPAEDFAGGECTVCMMPFDADDKVVELPCRHRFHRGCITKWLHECRRTCPNCGSDALPA